MDAAKCSCDLCCAARDTQERDRAAARLLDVEWLAEQMWRTLLPTADPRSAARAIIAEAKKP